MDEAEVQEQLAAMKAEISGLHEQVATLRAQLDTGPAPSATPSIEGAVGPQEATTDEPPSSTTSRRALLGGAVAAAAAVTGVLATAQPAAASTGTMVYGSTNNAAASETTLISTSASSTLVVSNGAGAGLASTTGSGTAVRGSATGGVGVHAISSTGTGLRAESTGHGWGGWISSGQDIALVLDSPRSHLLLSPGTRVAPTGDAVVHYAGELICDRDSALWACTVTGTPGTWTKLGGGSAAGAFHLLTSPVRIYDSRPGSVPAVGTKTPLAGGETRILDASANNSGLAAGTTGIVVTCMVVNAAAGNGNFTVWADGVARPSANAMVWGGTDGRHSTLAVTAVSAASKIKVSSSIPTDVVIDVVGYYR